MKSNNNEIENVNQDVWSSIRFLRKKMKTSRNDGDTSTSSFIQKSHNTTRLSNDEINDSKLYQKMKEKISESEIQKPVDNSKSTTGETNFTSSILMKEKEAQQNKENMEAFLQGLETASEVNDHNKMHENSQSLIINDQKLEEIENLKKDITNMQKEHNKSIKNLQNYHLFELEEKEKFFKEELESIKESYEKELSIKDKEIEMEKRKNKNYEEMINLLKSDFQNELIKQKNKHDKDLNIYAKEIGKLEAVIEEMETEKASLEYINNKENRFTENKAKLNSTNKNDKHIQTLLSKIKRCMDKQDNNIDFEGTILSERCEFMFPKNNVFLTTFDNANDTMSKLNVAEEFPDDYLDENERMQVDEDMSVGDDEKMFWMNYSIKNLNDKIKLLKK